MGACTSRGAIDEPPSLRDSSQGSHGSAARGFGTPKAGSFPARFMCPLSNVRQGSDAVFDLPTRVVRTNQRTALSILVVFALGFGIAMVDAGIFATFLRAKRHS